ncbi:Cardioacceleratory peptide receptor [Nymphon striatum]|nr:Cardioacceleratory peptide receptor [Nymphon striatum]
MQFVPVAYEINGTGAHSISSMYYTGAETLTVLWIIFATIVIGNCAVLLALALSKSRRSRMTFFIMHLAIAGRKLHYLSVGLVHVLTDIVWKTTIRFDGGPVVCKIVKYCQVVVTFSSTYVLVALSIDRFDAIIHPMNFSSSWTRAKILIAIAWILSAVFSTPMLFLYDIEMVSGLPQCWIDLKGDTEWQVYIMVIALALFFIPTLIITACYGAIMYTIWTKSKTMMGTTVTNRSNFNNKGKLANGGAGAKKNGENCSKRASSRGIIPKAKIKTVKMTCVIVMVFVFCWSPYFLFDIFQVFGHVKPSARNVAIATFINSLSPLNSAANPIIYCLFSTAVCRNLRRIPIFNWIAEKICPCCSSPISTPSRTSAAYRSCYSTTLSDNSRMTSCKKTRLAHDRGVQLEVIDGNVVCRYTGEDSDAKTARSAV